MECMYRQVGSAAELATCCCNGAWKELLTSMFRLFAKVPLSVSTSTSMPAFTHNVKVCEKLHISRPQNLSQAANAKAGKLTVDSKLITLVLALSTSSAEVSAALIVCVRRRDHVVILYRRCVTALIKLINSVVRVCGPPKHTDHVAHLALAIGDLAGFGVFCHFEAPTDPAAAADAGGPAGASACTEVSGCF
jgi:hypothetical protein